MGALLLLLGPCFDCSCPIPEVETPGLASKPNRTKLDFMEFGMPLPEWESSYSQFIHTVVLSTLAYDDLTLGDLD